MNEDKEYEKLKSRISFAIGKAMNKGLSPVYIKSALEECPLCLLFNETNFKRISEKCNGNNTGDEK